MVRPSRIHCRPCRDSGRSSSCPQAHCLHISVLWTAQAAYAGRARFEYCIIMLTRLVEQCVCPHNIGVLLLHPCSTYCLHRCCCHF